MNFEILLKETAATTAPEPITPIHDQLARMAFDNVRPHLADGALILDIGCGQGVALKLFRDANLPAIGMGINQVDIQHCADRGFAVMECDMHRLWDQNKYQMVWARHVLEHSPCPLLVLKKAAEALVENGILYVEVPAPDTCCNHEFNPNHFSVMGQGMWESLVRRAGFQIIEARQYNLETQVGPDIYLAWICKKE